MDLQGTLERGFSLQEPCNNERAERYKSFKVPYKHEANIGKRYAPTLKHLIPIRTDKWLVQQLISYILL